MSWCDKLAAVPAVGFKFDPHYASFDSILRALSPLVDTWVAGDRPTFNVEQQDPFTFSLNKEDGFVHGIDPTKASVEFKYRMKAKAISAGPPTVELLSPPRPYSELLPDASKQLLRMVSLLTTMHPRKVERVGITSTTIVAQSETPPGVLRFIEYVSRPWNASPEEFNFLIVAPLATTKGWSDRCVHVLTKSRANEDLLTIRFDWQRIFSTPRPATSESLDDMIEVAQRESLKYFEDLAEGNRFDEELISAARA